MTDGIILCSICGTSDMNRGSSITIDNRRGTSGMLHRQQFDFCSVCLRMVSSVNLNAESGATSLTGRVAIGKAKHAAHVSREKQPDLPFQPY